MGGKWRGEGWVGSGVEEMGGQGEGEVVHMGCSCSCMLFTFVYKRINSI